MKKTTWLFLFVFIFLADLLAVYMESEIARYFTKPLLMPLLVAHFVSGTKHVASDLKKWTILALMFSWAGDVLLIFESMNSNFFIFGLLAFLLAHIFYIVLFDKIRVRESFKQSILPLVPIAVYYILLISLLEPHLAEMGKPVRVYGIIISIMLSFAIDLWRLSNKATAAFIITGATLFIFSDSLLAINKFYNSFENAGIAVMLTYGLAQLLITIGVERYISSLPTHKFVE